MPKAIFFLNKTDENTMNKNRNQAFASFRVLIATLVISVVSLSQLPGKFPAFLSITQVLAQTPEQLKMRKWSQKKKLAA
ncbi:MAG: hypothetical protein F6K09_37450, partial [Merismopedia sp. SIO2A8]|nr:hypothetical protein [Merismopedia sp. SIO2A8]